MSAEVVVYGVALGVPEKFMIGVKAYMDAAARANMVKPDYAVKSQADRDSATMDRATIKAGIKIVEELAKKRAWITDPKVAEAFGVLEAADARAKAEAKRVVGLLKGRVEIIDAAIVTWTRDEERKAAEARRLQQEQEAAAAKAAAEAAANAMDPDEEAPIPAQPIVPQAEPVQRHSSIGEAKSTVKSSPVMCELYLDPEVKEEDRLKFALMEVMNKWPYLLKIDEVAAKAECNALIARKAMDKPSEVGTVVGGIRFFTKMLVSG